MQIEIKNPTATEALWNALVGLADKRIAAGEQVGDSMMPYSIVYLDTGSVEKVVISGNNASMSVTRKAEGDVVQYRVSDRNHFAKAVHDQMNGIVNEAFSDNYLAELIRFVEWYRTSEAAEFRRQAASAELRSANTAKAIAEFRNLLAQVSGNRLDLHKFYKPDTGVSDMDQLVSKPQTLIEPGIYSYAPLGSGGEATRVVFVSKSHNVLVAFLHEGMPAIVSSNDKLEKLLKEYKLHTGELVRALRDPDSIANQLFNEVQSDEPATHNHTFDEMLKSLGVVDPTSLRAASPARARMFAGSDIGRALAGALLFSNTLAAVRDSIEVDEICPGCGVRH